MLTPLFTVAGLVQVLEDDIQMRARKVALGLSYFGEETVNKARICDPNDGSYIDRTGNLRSSIGYLVVSLGKHERQDFTGGSLQEPEGIREGKRVARDAVAGDPDTSITLAIVAGMEYAPAVESRGYRVLTSFVPKEYDVAAMMRDAFSGDIRV